MGDDNMETLNQLKATLQENLSTTAADTAGDYIQIEW